MNRPEPNVVFELVRMDGVESLGLKPEEAFVLTRVDGHTTLGQIASIVGFDVDRVWALLSRCVEGGFVRVREATPKPKRPGKRDPFVAKLDAEDQDPELSKIPRELRKELRERYDGLEKKNYYEVLMVDPKAPTAQIKKAYLMHVKKLHPDRFFGKALGPYAKILEDLFEKVSKAYEELSQEAKRRSYDRTIKKTQSTQEDASEKKKPKVQKFGNTLIERIAQAKKQYAQGKREEELGNFLAAANFYQAALQYDSKNETYRTSFERLKPALDRRRAEEFYRKGREAMDLGDAKRALYLLEEAVALKIREKECFRDLTMLYRRLKGSGNQAINVGEQALKYFPEDADLHATVGHICLAAGSLDRAEKAFKAALRLEKRHLDASRGLDELKRK